MGTPPCARDAVKEVAWHHAEPLIYTHGGSGPLRTPSLLVHPALPPAPAHLSCWVISSSSLR